MADDLLKNDGKKFLDMMERLAERRIQKEDEVMEQTDDYYDDIDEDEDEVYDEEEEEVKGCREFLKFDCCSYIVRLARMNNGWKKVDVCSKSLLPGCLSSGYLLLIGKK